MEKINVDKCTDEFYLEWYRLRIEAHRLEVECVTHKNGVKLINVACLEKLMVSREAEKNLILTVLED